MAIKKNDNFGIKATDEPGTMALKLASALQAAIKKIETLEKKVATLEGKPNGKQSKITK